MSRTSNRRKKKIGINFFPEHEEDVLPLIFRFLNSKLHLGYGGHGKQEHGNHGIHEQVSVGIGSKNPEIKSITYNFRKIIDDTET